ncbi:hypothetical protein pb186bvf_015604 [Paramecium bursaria]
MYFGNVIINLRLQLFFALQKCFDQNGSLLRRLYLGQNLNQGNLIEIQDYSQQLQQENQQENQDLKKKVQQQT